MIIVSGTPGTGKTSLAKKLAKCLGYKYLDVNRLIKLNKIEESYDKRRRCYIVDVKKLNKLLIEKIKQNPDIVIDSHLSHYLPKRYVDVCVVTTCNLKLLEKRLKKRGYNRAKIRENLDAEILQVCLQEAKEAGHRVIAVDTTKKVSLKDILNNFI